jgi:hypothetical protein
LKPKKLWRDAPPYHFARAICLSPPCFFRTAGSSTIEIIPENYVLALAKNTEIILPKKNSHIEIIFSETNSRLSLRDLSILNLSEINPLYFGIDTSQEKAFTLDWVPGSIAGFAQQAPSRTKTD